MLICPACGAAIDDDAAWMCPVCEHVVRTEILGLEQTDDLSEIARQASADSDVTSPHLLGVFDVTEAQTLTGEEAIYEDEPADARIIGDLDDETAISAVFPTPASLAGPSISKVILYAPVRSWRLLQPGAVPTVVDSSRSASPLEMAALALIDGVRSVDEIRRETDLPRNEIDGALLLLVDKGVIRLDLEAARERPPSVLEPVYPTEMTAEDAGEDPANESDRTQPPRPRPRIPTPPALAPARKSDLPAPKRDVDLPAPKLPAPKGGLPAPKKNEEAPPVLDDDLLEEVFTSGGVPTPPPSKRSGSPADTANAAAAPAPLPPSAIAPIPAPAPAAPPAAPKAAPKTHQLADRVLELAKRSDPRARKLIDQAAKDIERRELASAETNLKLALTFDPKNGELRRMLIEVSSEAPKERKAPAKVSQRAAMLDQATEKEAAGDVDGAIDILERALRLSKDAAVYNRLGVILATKKRDIARGRELIEKAVELAPDNETYQHNLGKVLARAAAADLADRKSGKSAGGGDGIFGIFGKKKS